MANQTEYNAGKTAIEIAGPLKALKTMLLSTAVAVPMALFASGAAMAQDAPPTRQCF